MLKKFIPVLLSASITASMLPTAFASDPGSWYIETFDSDENIGAVISEKQNGWSYDGADGASVDIWVGDNGNDSNSLRISNGDSWFKNIWASVDLGESIKAAFTAGGKTEADAEKEISAVLGNDAVISFSAKFEVQGVSNNDQPHQSYIRVKDDRSDILTELRTMDDRLCIRARNSEDTELTDFTVKNIDISAHNNEWHDFSIEYDFDAARCRIAVDGVTAETDSGEWIPLGTNDTPVDSLSAIGSMEAGEYWSGWWQCVYLDDIAVDPVSEAQPTAAPSGDKEILYSEDFEAEGLADTITNQESGWSYNSDNAGNQIDIEVSDKENTSNALRFSSKDWYKTMWLDLDLKENGIAKRVAAGESEANAQAAVEKYLSEDMTLSFTAKLDVDGISDNPSDVHESYIKIKNADTAAITELHTKGNILYLRGLGNEEYHEIKEINIAKENTEYHKFEISYSMAENTYRIKVDGESVSIDGSEDIPAGAGEGGAVIGSVSTIELGHHWSGWWQRLIIDDISIAKDHTVQPTADPDSTPTPKPTPRPTAVPTPAPTEEPGVYYYEPFEENGLQEEITNQENGWSIGTADNSVGFENVSVDNYKSGSGKALRFSSTDWYKNVWMTLDLAQNGTSKLIDKGLSADEAQQKTNAYLSGDVKMSFRARFEQDGTEEGHTHEQYIRIKGEDGHVITDIHVNNNALVLIALNEEKNANTTYLIKNIDWKKDANEWHDFVICYDKTRNAYMIEVDGEIFRTPHGRWIPAGSGTGLDASEPKDIGKISSIELGHYWSGWWGSLHFDSLKLSEYTPEPEVFEIANVNIVNQHGSTSLSPGNGYDAVVYTTGGEAAKIEKAWSKSTDNGKTWEPMTEASIPAEVNRIKVVVTAVSTNGETSEFTKEAEVNPSGSIDYESLMSETFESANKEAEIRAQTNGWTITGNSIQVDIGSGFGGTANSLRFASTNSGQNSNLSLDLAQRGAAYNPGDKIRVKFSFSFGLGSDDDTLTSSSSSYVRLKNTDGTAFSAIELRGETMYVIYYDEQAGKNKGIEIASGKSRVIDQWRSVEVYLDTGINRYCVIIDGKAVSCNGKSWFIPSDSIVEGSGSPMTVSGVGMIDIGQESSVWWANTCIDNISAERYYLPSENKFKVDDMLITNAYMAKQPLVCGAPAAASPVVELEPEIAENGVITDCVYTWSYTDVNGNEKAMDSTFIPYDAVSVKVSGSFKNAVGQEAVCRKEASVGSNTAPSVSDLKVDGEYSTGSVLKAEYSFTDKEAPDTDNTVVSWYRADKAEGPYTLIVEGAKEYTLKNADMTRYIKVTAVPKDSFGAEGTPVEKLLSADGITEFDEAWSRLSIPSELAASVTYISLPASDTASGITFTWTSSDNSAISSSGAVSHDKTYKNVVLTATAVNAAGEKEVKLFTVGVAASGTASTKPSYGGGGGGGGGSSSGGYVPTPVQSATPTAAPAVVPDSGGKPDTSDNGGKADGFFPDVPTDSWYYEYVESLAGAGIVNGDDAGRFNPEAQVTRSEFLKMLVGIFNIMDPDAVCSFEDVPADSWYYGYVASAVKFGIADGMGDGTFHPNDRISRQDMAVMSARAAQLSGILPETACELSFADSDSIADYAKASVSEMEAAGILSGTDGMFDPVGNTTRAQAAKVISMLMNLLKTE